MTPQLLHYLCEPITKELLQLVNAVTDNDGHIQSGDLIAPSGKCYPIINGIPRFVDFVPTKTVESFGDEWNYFNFTDFKINWLSHTVANTFGSTDVFKGKLIVDAGGGERCADQVVRGIWCQARDHDGSFSFGRRCCEAQFSRV